MQPVGRENVWLPFILWSTALNAIFCVSVVGPSALSAVYREASSRDLGLVCTFSFLWGSGTACFSLGIQLVRPKFNHARVRSLAIWSSRFRRTHTFFVPGGAQPVQVSQHPVLCARGGIMWPSRRCSLPHLALSGANDRPNRPHCASPRSWELDQGPLSSCLFWW